MSWTGDPIKFTEKAQEESTTSNPFTTADENKLDGIATGATANDTDANLKARANHTGTQPASTISDLNSAVAVGVENLNVSIVDAVTIGFTKAVSGGAETNITSSASSVTMTNMTGPSALALLQDGLLVNYAVYTTTEAGSSLGYIFPSSEYVSKIRVYSLGSTERIKDILVEYSSDSGSSWIKKPIISVADNASLNNTDEGRMSNADGWNTFVLTGDIASTHWRIRSTAVWGVGDQNAGVAELQMYANPVSVPAVPLHVNPDSISNTYLSNMAQSTIKGRVTASTGDPEDLTATQVRTLINVANGATANDTDANLKNRANHTGTQTASTISDFDSAVAANAAVAANTAKVSNIPTALSIGTQTSATLAITSDGGEDDVILPQAIAGGNAGVMSGVDKTKLDGIESGAKAPATLAGAGLVVNGSTLDISIDSDEMVIRPLVQGNTTFTLSGTNRFDNVGVALNSILAGAITICLEVDMSSLADDKVIYQKTGGTSGFELTTGGTGGELFARVKDSSSYQVTTASGVLSVGAGFQKIVWVIELTQFRLYVDGVEIGSAVTGFTSGTPQTTHTFRIGGDTSGRGLGGSIRNLTVYTGAASNPTSWAPTDHASLTGATKVFYSATGDLELDPDGYDFIAGGSPTPVTSQAIPEEVGIKTNSVLNDKLVNVAADTIKGRANGAGTGAPQDLTPAQVRTIINTEFTLTDAATIAWDIANGNSAKVTLTDNRTLGNPTNLKAGETYSIRVIQDATGSRTLAYGANYKFSTTIPSPTLSTVAAKEDILTFYSDGTNMYLTSALLGF